jgi:hypothetical protein
MELALAKPMKKTRKFALDSSMVPASGLGDAGASSSRAPTAVGKKAVGPGKGRWINPVFMLGAASPRESQDSSPHEPTPKTSDEAPIKSAKLAAASAATEAATWLPLVTTTAGSGARASLAFTAISAG